MIYNHTFLKMISNSVQPKIKKQSIPANVRLLDVKRCTANVLEKGEYFQAFINFQLCNQFCECEGCENKEKIFGKERISKTNKKKLK